MPINKSFSILDVSEQVKENFEDTQPSFESKNKNYQRNRKKHHDEDKILTVLGFTFDSKKDNYQPKKTVDAFNNNCIQYQCKEDKEKLQQLKNILI